MSLPHSFNREDIEKGSSAESSSRTLQGKITYHFEQHASSWSVRPFIKKVGYRYRLYFIYHPLFRGQRGFAIAYTYPLGSLMSDPHSRRTPVFAAHFLRTMEPNSCAFESDTFSSRAHICKERACFEFAPLSLFPHSR